MRKLAILLGLATIFYSSSCSKQVIIGETANLDLDFKLLYDGEPLIFGNFYDYSPETQISIDRFSYFISDLVLIGESGSDELELKEIDFLDYNKIDDPFPVTSPVINSRINNIPSGEYSAIKMGIGVNSELNATLTSEYSSSHPLGQADLYWDELNTFIFTMIKGGFDTDGNGDLDRIIFFRAGTTNLYTEVTIPVQLILRNSETGTLSFTVDLKKLLTQNNSEMLGVDELANNVDTPDLVTMQKVMNSFPEAIQLE